MSIHLVIVDIRALSRNLALQTPLKFETIQDKPRRSLLSRKNFGFKKQLYHFKHLISVTWDVL